MTVSGAVCGLAHIAAFAGYQTSDFRTEFNTQNSFIKDCSKEHARVRRASSAKELRKSYMVKIKSNRRRDADPTWIRDTLARRLVKKEFRSEGETAHYLRVFTVLMRCWAQNICRREGIFNVLSGFASKVFLSLSAKRTEERIAQRFTACQNRER